MSNSIDVKAVYQPTKDPLYDVTQKTVPVDSSTLYRGEQRITAQTGGSSATGLNVDGAQTKFIIQNGSNYKLRWDTCALSVRGGFDNGAGGACVNAVPAWNIIADQIDSIILTINDSSTAIYNVANGLYVYDYSARMLRNYTWDVLNSMDEQLFTPLEGEGAANITPAFITKTFAAAGPPPTYTFPAENNNQQIRRLRHRVSELLARESKFIPFQDLFPRFPSCVMNNLRKIQIEIVWRNHSIVGMEDYVGAGARNPLERYFITNCEIITDYYVLTPATQVTEMNQKSAQVVDNVAYLNTQVLAPVFNGGDIMISGLKNVESVMVMQLSRGQPNSIADLNANHVEGISCGQFQLIDVGATSLLATYPTNQTEVGAGALTPITTVQMQMGEVTYPPQEIPCGTDLTHLYHEYLKTLNACASRTTKPMPFHIFKTTMPFICLKPWANNAPHLSREGRELQLRIRSTLPANAGREIAIIVFKLMTMQIQPDASISVNY